MFLGRQMHLPLQPCLLSSFPSQYVCRTWVYHYFCFIYIERLVCHCMWLGGPIGSRIGGPTSDPIGGPIYHFFALFTLKDWSATSCGLAVLLAVLLIVLLAVVLAILLAVLLAVLFPARFMNFSFEFCSTLGSAEMLFFSATTSRTARTETYPSIHYLYPGLSSRGESGRSMKLTGHLLTVQRIRILEAAGLLSHNIHCLVPNPLYHCVVTIFTTCIYIKQLYIVPRQCVFCIIPTTDHVYVPTYHEREM